jgi:hypothetical protein
MCGACGILGGGPDWVERVGDPDAPGTAGRTRLAERQRRIVLVNRLLAASGMRLNEHGRQLILRSATGRAKLVTDLAHVWAAADLLGRKKVDPLDEAFLTTLQTSVGNSAS